MAPAASPIVIQFDPTSGPLEKAIVSFPPTGLVSRDSSVSPQYSGAVAT